MSFTNELAQLIDRLRTDAQLQNTYRSNPAAATEGFALTLHERDATVTKDLDDFVAIGLVWSIWELPEVMRGPWPGGLTGLRLRLALELRKRLHLRPPDDRFKPRPGRSPKPVPGPRPGPGPDPPPPGPEPRPGPRPGPDPPGPDF